MAKGKGSTCNLLQQTKSLISIFQALRSKTSQHFISSFFNFASENLAFCRSTSFFLQACFNAWLQLKKKGDEKRDERKQLVLALLSKNVKEIKTDDAIFMTGLVAPPAAMVLKKSSENVPQLKKFRLNLIPDIFFVPSCTVIALFTVKLLQLKTGGKTQ
ncbi:hypothetical protein AXF42_Ash006317 [Apostasia shenzhenica]|uniref:Uncharacterized protein n=1 Tax=Apostasia shenzhenica TaxID=1088818 RepID=A0A2I0AYQ4_9ASPA|nr:hypothetical protein AXF42_Ash006317 [Apostasia shenzhenica]